MSTPTEANLRPRRSSRAKHDVDYDTNKLQRLEYRRAKAQEKKDTRRKRSAKKRRKKNRERKKQAQEQALLNKWTASARRAFHTKLKTLFGRVAVAFPNVGSQVLSELLAELISRFTSIQKLHGTDGNSLLLTSVSPECLEAMEAEYEVVDYEFDWYCENPDTFELLERLSLLISFKEKDGTKRHRTTKKFFGIPEKFEEEESILQMMENNQECVRGLCDKHGVPQNALCDIDGDDMPIIPIPFLIDLSSFVDRAERRAHREIINVRKQRFQDKRRKKREAKRAKELQRAKELRRLMRRPVAPVRVNRAAGHATAEEAMDEFARRRRRGGIKRRHSERLSLFRPDPAPVSPTPTPLSQVQETNYSSDSDSDVDIGIPMTNNNMMEDENNNTVDKQLCSPEMYSPLRHWLGAPRVGEMEPEMYMNTAPYDPFHGSETPPCSTPGEPYFDLF